MDREITRTNVREIVRRGLEEARGNYKIVARLFNMEPRDYKRFLNFLRKHDCQIPFKDYRYPAATSLRLVAGPKARRVALCEPLDKPLYTFAVGRARLVIEQG